MGMKFFSNEFDHITKMAAMPICGTKTFKIFFTRTNRPMTLEFGK